MIAGYADDTSQGAESLYTIGYGAVEVADQVLIDDRGARLDVWAHRARGAVISVTSTPSCGLTSDSSVADKAGWTRFRCPVSLPPSPDGYLVTAEARIKGRSVAATTTLLMPEAAYDTLTIDELRILVRQGATWQPASQIPLNRMVRLAVLYGATEKAGNWFPPCVSGSITVKKGTQVLWSGAPVCDSALPSTDGRPYVYLDVYLADPADLGTVDVQIALQYYGHGDTKTFQKMVVDGLPGASQR